MNTIKRICKFIASMRFAIILLVALALACSIGSLVTQGQSYDWYAQHTSERAAALILALGLDDAFHSAWFIVITAFLCVNLLLPLCRRVDAIQDEEQELEARMEPSIAHIQKTFRGVERFMMLQALYRLNGYKPFYALKGSLPLLLEIPFFIAA